MTQEIAKNLRGDGKTLGRAHVGVWGAGLYQNNREEGGRIDLGDCSISGERGVGGGEDMKGGRELYVAGMSEPRRELKKNLFWEGEGVGEQHIKVG